MVFLSILAFIAINLGLGFTITRFVEESSNLLERNLIRIGLSLSALPLIGIILSLIKIPVDWRIFLLISIAYPLYHFFKNYRHFKFNFRFRLKKSDLNLFVVILIFILVFYMYLKGAFAYPYLEDDDSWSHAIGAKYVAMQKTFFNPSGGIHYLDPYPPVYDGFMGLMSQISNSVFWTLKFFNALVISLSIMFFYLFAKEFTNNSKVALFSTIALSMIPAYLSHFIWAHAFIPGFIFLSFLFLEKIKHNKRWMYIASLPVAAVILTTVTQSIKFMFLFLIYFTVKSIIERRFITEIFSAVVLGFIVSLIWWVPLTVRYGNLPNLFKNLGLAENVFNLRLDFLNSIYFYMALILLIAIASFGYYLLKGRLSAGQKSLIGITSAILILAAYIIAYSNLYGVGTADRIYDFNDFFIAHKQNMINNPIGIGVALFSFFFITLILIVYKIFSTIIQKKESLAGMQFYSLMSLSSVSAALLVISSLTFFLFRFKPGIFLKQWMLRIPENYNYVHSFAFKLWGAYFFIGSLIAIASIYIFLIYMGYIKKERLWLAIAMLWFVYVFAGLYDIPTQYFTFRTWTLLAFILSIIIGYGFVSLLDLTRRLHIPKIVTWTALIVLIFLTSGIQKYAVNTAIWPPGAFWTSNEELQGYVWFKDNIPSGTKVFTFSNNALIIGFDKFICHWCSDVIEFQKNGFNDTSQKTYDWLKIRNYEYIVIDGQTAKKFGVNETNNKLQSLLLSEKFLPVQQTQGFLMLRVAS